MDATSVTPPLLGLKVQRYDALTHNEYKSGKTDIRLMDRTYLNNGEYRVASELRMVDRELPEPNRSYTIGYKEYLELNNRKGKTIARRLGELRFILKSLNKDAKQVDRKAYWGDLLNDEKRKKLEHSSLYGFDVDQGMIRFARMNLLLHGLEAENVKRKDAIAIEYGQEEDRQYDVVLTNPPFAGRIDKTRIKKDLPIIATKTEILFLGHAIQLLKDNGRCGIIVPEGLLFGNTSAHKDIRRYLLEKCNLQAVISMPNGAFMPYSGVKTSVLIFQKGEPTNKVWFYELHNIGYGLGSKPIPVKENDIPDMLEKWKTKIVSEQSWFATFEDIKKHDFNLSATLYKPRKINNSIHKDPNKLLEEALTLQEESLKGLKELQKVIK
jgi:type I restriction enzyme M protein